MDYPALFQQTCNTPTSTVYQCNDALICTMTVLPQFSGLIQPSNGASGSLTASCTWTPFYGDFYLGGSSCNNDICINGDGSLDYNGPCEKTNFGICATGACSLVSGTINPLYTPNNCANSATNVNNPIIGFSNGFEPQIKKCGSIGNTETTPWYQLPSSSELVCM